MKNNNITNVQKDKINKIFKKAWDEIYDDVLDENNKNEKGIVLPGILFSIEEQINGFASTLGLAALDMD